VVLHAYIPNTWEAEAGGAGVQGQPKLKVRLSKTKQIPKPINFYPVISAWMIFFNFSSSWFINTHVTKCQISHTFQLFRTEESKQNIAKLAAILPVSLGAVLIVWETFYSIAGYWSRRKFLSAVCWPGVLTSSRRSNSPAFSCLFVKTSLCG
jgi:hypothetical protein